MGSHAIDDAVTTDASLTVAVPLEVIPHGPPLPYPIYVALENRFVLFRQIGDTVTERRAGSLLSHAADAVFVPKTHWAIFVRFLEDQDTQGSLLATRHLCCAYLKDVEEKKELFKHEIGRYRKATDHLAELIFNEPASPRPLIRRFHVDTLHFANHGANTAVYSVYVGKGLGLPLKDLKELSFAALFHDVGLLKVPQAVLAKSQRDEKERKSYESHAVKGGDGLKALGCSDAVARTALEHHERYDGGGFPTKASGSQIHKFAQICGLAQYYDSLQSKTTIQEPMAETDAKEKLKGLKNQFDSKLVEMILQF